MSRIEVSGFLILSLVVCLNMSLAADVSSIAKQVLPSTVLIQTYDANGNSIAQGSGFFVSKEGDIVTCYHVMKGYSIANVTTSDKKAYRVKNITAINKTNDLIKISLSNTSENFSSLKLNTTPVEIGEEIIVVGEPLGLENTVSNGIVSAIRDNKTQITAPISPGSSGGPVVNMKGEVIGIVSSQMKFGQNLNFAIPAFLVSTMQPASAGLVEELLTPDYSTEIEELDAPLWKILGYLSEEEMMKEHRGLISPDAEFYARDCYDKFGKTENFDNAIFCYDCVLKMKPSCAPAWNNKGIALYYLTRYGEALFCFNKSLDLDPSCRTYWQNKGSALQKLHRDAEAAATFTKAKEFSKWDSRYGTVDSSMGLVIALPDGTKAMKKFDSRSII